MQTSFLAWTDHWSIFSAELFDTYIYSSSLRVCLPCERETNITASRHCHTLTYPYAPHEQCASILLGKKLLRGRFDRPHPYQVHNFLTQLIRCRFSLQCVPGSAPLFAFLSLDVESRDSISTRYPLFCFFLLMDTEMMVDWWFEVIFDDVSEIWTGLGSS